MFLSSGFQLRYLPRFQSSGKRIIFNYTASLDIKFKRLAPCTRNLVHFQPINHFYRNVSFKRDFHKMSCNNAPWLIPAGVTLVAQQLSRFAFLTIPFFYRYNFFTKYPTFTKYFIGASLFLFFGSILAGLEYSEYGNRWRFSIVEDKYFLKMSKEYLQEILTTLPLNQNVISTKEFNSTKEIFSKLLISSGEKKQYILEKEWDLLISEQEDFNAVVYPTGTVIVNKGTYNFIESQDELAFILGHELSHLLFSHSAEFQTLSSIGDAVSLFLYASLTSISLIFPVFDELLSPLVSSGISGLFLMPRSRAQELEADKAALYIMARSGFDPRKAPGLWRRLAQLETTDKLDDSVSNIDATNRLKGCFSEVHFLQSLERFGNQSHPHSLERAIALEKMIPYVLPIYFDSINGIKEVSNKEGYFLKLLSLFGFTDSSELKFINSKDWQPLYKEINWNSIPSLEKK